MLAQEVLYGLGLVADLLHLTSGAGFNQGAGLAESEGPHSRAYGGSWHVHAMPSRLRDTIPRLKRIGYARQARRE